MGGSFWELWRRDAGSSRRVGSVCVCVCDMGVEKASSM